MIGNRRILAVTLARGGSKRIPRKNIAFIGGRPLISYTFDSVKNSKYIDEYIVSTDDYDIIDVAQENGVRSLKRPADLAEDSSTSADAMIHAVKKVGQDFYYIVEIMATNPLKTAEDIDSVIEMLYDKDADSVASVVRIYDHHPSRVKYISDTGIMIDFYPEILESRRQDLLPEAYVRNGSIYAMKKDFLLSEKTRYNKETLAYIMPEERTINIDEPIDLLVADFIIREKS